MSTARDDILGNIRRALGVTASDRIRRQAVDDRLERSPRGIIPKRGQLDSLARRALFQERAEAVHTTVETVARQQDVPGAVAAFLRGRNLPAALRMGADPYLVAMSWEDTQVEVKPGRSDGHDAVAISHAIAGVAETGTLALISGSDNPTTLNFLPDTHIVVLRATNIVGDYESVWAKLRMNHGKGVLPRTVNLITGPSRSGDIEQKLQLGAHGPRGLHIVIVES